MQRFSIFHDSAAEILKAWHRPYAEVMAGCAPVLDVGCGLGYFADLLQERGVECVGLDIDPAMVEANAERGHAAHVGNHASINALGRKFGGIHISHVVEHLWGEELIELLEQCAANLNPGGRIVIRTPNWEVEEVRLRIFWSDHTHRRPYNVAGLTKILRDMGFHIEAAGPEPYGQHDLFVVATNGPRSDQAKLDFSRDPFPPRPRLEKLRRHIPAWMKPALRPLRNGFRRLKGR